MLGIPWWGWLIGLLVALVVVLWLARKSFRRQVRKQFVEFLRATHADIEIREEHETHLVTSMNQSENSQLFLGKLYQAIAELRPDTPESRRMVFEHFIGSLLESARDAAGPLDLQTHGARIMPRLLLMSQLAEFPDEIGPVHTSLEGIGLEVVYVLDSERSVMYLTEHHLNELGLDRGALHARALENLAQTFPNDLVRKVLEENALPLFKALDSYDAARLLLVPGCLRENEALAAVIPDRDSLCLAPIPENGDWSHLKKLARTPGGDQLLLNRPLKVTQQGFELM
jgi:uncharacterized protein YtpQ (UPF0354 family)